MGFCELFFFFFFNKMGPYYTHLKKKKEKEKDNCHILLLIEGVKLGEILCFRAESEYKGFQAFIRVEREIEGSFNSRKTSRFHLQGRSLSAA